MTISAGDAQLIQIPVDKIDRNPDNPRMVFRPGELDELLESIRTYGIQVPISVYKEAGRYVLIDGERRWRCATKLNNERIPALVQAKPKPLENLLLMFNIHALREQWDLLTIALKLPKIIQLLEKELKRTPTEKELSEKTGLKRALIRRCKLLIALPKQYTDQILDELKKPKAKQKITEDLFIEMERSLTTVSRAIPSVIPDRDKARRALLKKFEDNVITNRVEFRSVAKIARAKNVGVETSKAAKELNRLFADHNYTIKEAYENSVAEAYRERDLGTRVGSLLELLNEIEVDDLDDEVLELLKRLQKRIKILLQDS